MVPNIKFKWSKITSDRFVQLPNGKIATSTKYIFRSQVAVEVKYRSFENTCTSFHQLGTGQWTADKDVTLANSLLAYKVLKQNRSADD